MGMGRVWIRRGREMGGENGRHVRGGVFYLDVNLFCPHMNAMRAY